MGSRPSHHEEAGWASDAVAEESAALTLGRWSYTITQGVVTVALLVVAVVLRDNPHVTDLIVGAVVSQWLRESVYVGQTLARGAPPPPPPESNA